MFQLINTSKIEYYLYNIIINSHLSKYISAVLLSLMIRWSALFCPLISIIEEMNKTIIANINTVNIFILQNGYMFLIFLFYFMRLLRIKYEMYKYTNTSYLMSK